MLDRRGADAAGDQERRLLVLRHRKAVAQGAEYPESVSGLQGDHAERGRTK